jgi:hypothetical protein
MQNHFYWTCTQTLGPLTRETLHDILPCRDLFDGCSVRRDRVSLFGVFDFRLDEGFYRCTTTEWNHDNIVLVILFRNARAFVSSFLNPRTV